jgi:hypothetical protein
MDNVLKTSTTTLQFRRTTSYASFVTKDDIPGTARIQGIDLAHIFHADCLKQWLNKNKRCFICWESVNKRTFDMFGPSSSNFSEYHQFIDNSNNFERSQSNEFLIKDMASSIGGSSRLLEFQDGADVIEIAESTMDHRPVRFLDEQIDETYKERICTLQNTYATKMVVENQNISQSHHNNFANPNFDKIGKKTSVDVQQNTYENESVSLPHNLSLQSS